MSNKSVVNIDLIRSTRIKNGVSMEEMSSLLGYEAANTYFRKEKGDRKFNVEDIVKISSVLEIPIQKLFFEKVVTEKVIKRVG